MIMECPPSRVRGWSGGAKTPEVFVSLRVDGKHLSGGCNSVRGKATKAVWIARLAVTELICQDVILM